MSDTTKAPRALCCHDLWEIVPDPPRACCADWRQTGTCGESQADGVPCERPDGRCEDCDRSELDCDC